MSDKLKLYKLNYSGAEINERLEKVDANFDRIAENLAAINENSAADAQFKAEVANTYAKKSDMPNMELYALKSELPVMPDLTNYALKSDLPNMADYALKSDIPEGQDLSAYVTKTELQEAGFITELPEIPVVPTNVSAFENDANYLTEHQSLSGYATKDYVDNKVADVVGGAPETLDTLKEIADALNDNATMTMVSDAIATKANADDVYTKTEIDNKGFITELPEIPTVPTNVSAFENDANYLTHQSLENYATKQYVDDAVAEVAGGGEINLDAYVTKTELQEAAYITSNDIPEIPTVPTNVSAFANDANYLTSETLPAIPSIDGLATETYVSEKIAEVVGGAPETLDTLNEIATALNDNATMTMVSEAISTKANSADVYTKAEIDAAGYLTQAYTDTLYQAKGEYLTEHQSLVGYATTDYVDNKVAEVSTGGEINLDAYTTKEYVDNNFQPKGEYLTEEDLQTEQQNFVNTVNELLVAYVTTEALEQAGYITSNDVPTNVSAFENDANYLTLATLPEYPSTNGLATETFVSEEIAKVVGGAPETLDTLNEIATALNDNATMTMVSEAISTKANSADVYTKTEIDEAGYLTQTDTDALYQPKGEYLTEHQSLADYVTISYVEANYQPKGEYLTEHQSLANYATLEYVNGKIAELQALIAELQALHNTNEPEPEPEPSEPEQSVAPTLAYDNETFTVSATGEGTVIMYVDGEEVENPHTFLQGENEVTYTVTATAQQEDKTVSDTVTLDCVVPAVNKEEPTPDDPEINEPNE